MYLTGKWNKLPLGTHTSISKGIPLDNCEILIIKPRRFYEIKYFHGGLF